MTRFALLLLAVTAWASPRTVSGPLQNPSNSGANGTVTVEWQTFTAGDGSLIVAGTRTTSVSSGTYSQTFEPTGDASPSGVTYKVTYRFGSSSPAICYWSIPAGSGAVLIADIQTCSPPSSPAGTIALSQLSIGGGADGQCAIISAGVWAPGSCTASWTVNANDIYNSNSGNVGIGATPGDFKLDISKSGSTGTLRVYDQTASTGVTYFGVVAGAGQASNNLGLIQAATNQLIFASDGSFTTGIISSSKNKVRMSSASTPGIRFSSDSLAVWRDTDNLDGSATDVGIGRNAAGVLEVNNGTPGTYRDMKFRDLTLTGLSGSGSKYVCVDNTGKLSVGSSC